MVPYYTLLDDYTGWIDHKQAQADFQKEAEDIGVNLQHTDTTY